MPLIIIGTVLGFVVGTYLRLVLGYLFGMLIAITPWVSDWLTVGGLIDKGDFPAIIAWAFVITGFIPIRGGVGENGVENS